MTDIHSERLTKQNVHLNLSQTSKIEVLNFSTRVLSRSILLSRLYVHWGHFGLEDSTLIVVALVLPSSPSLSLASQTLSVWLARLPSLRWKVNCCSACAEPGAKSKVYSYVQKKICPWRSARVVYTAPRVCTSVLSLVRYLLPRA